jgi:hypothetical protein
MESSPCVHVHAQCSNIMMTRLKNMVMMCYAVDQDGSDRCPNKYLNEGSTHASVEIKRTPLGFNT